MKNSIDVSVIIVNYNVRFFLEQCILSVIDASSKLNVEIIVVDNNSQDDSCQLVKDNYPQIQIVENDENIGFSRACNQASKRAQGTYLLVLNPDTVIEEDSLEKLISLYRTKQNLGISGVKIIDGSGNFAPESKRGIPTPHTTFNKLFGISSKRTGKYYATHLKENESGVVDVLSGSFMFIPKRIYYEAGGFDESFFMYGEDIDLSYRVLLKGYTNYYLASVRVLHYKGESTKRDIKYLRCFNSAMEIFYEKHFKLNILYDFLMKIGIQFWYLLKYLKFKFNYESSLNIGKIQFFEKGEIVMYCADKKYLLINDEKKGKKELFQLINSEKIDTIVFDNSEITNKTIMRLMQELSDEKVVFKIRPRNTNFLISSAHSKSKGEIELIS